MLAAVGTLGATLWMGGSHAWVGAFYAGLLAYAAARPAGDGRLLTALLAGKGIEKLPGTSLRPRDVVDGLAAASLRRVHQSSRCPPSGSPRSITGGPWRCSRSPAWPSAWPTARRPRLCPRGGRGTGGMALAGALLAGAFRVMLWDRSGWAGRPLTPRWFETTALSCRLSWQLPTAAETARLSQGR
jgi:hypothetical protein